MAVLDMDANNVSANLSATVTDLFKTELLIQEDLLLKINMDKI